MLRRQLAKSAPTQATHNVIKPVNTAGTKQIPSSGRIDKPSTAPTVNKYSRFAPRDNPYYTKQMRLAVATPSFAVEGFHFANTFTEAEKALADRGGSSTRPIVSVEWLRKQLANPSTANTIQLIDCSWRLSNPEGSKTPYEEFLEKHIPGAVFLDIDEIAGDVVSEDGQILPSSKPHRVPSDQVFNVKAATIGVSPFTRPVLYDSTGMLGAARVLWTFHLMGFHDAVVLEGGLPAWVASDAPVEQGVAREKLGSVEAYSGDRNTLATVSDIEENLFDKKMLVLDARSPGRFNGTDPEPRPGYQSGHIPGSLNVPYGELVVPCGISGGMKLRSFPEIVSVLEKAGVPMENPDLPIVASCGSGMTASTLFLALKTAGFRNVKLYDGSWMEWANPEENRPIATAATPVKYLYKKNFKFTPKN